MNVARSGAIGDVLMCTPALRQLKRLRPGSRICFHTNFPSLVQGLPYIDEVLPMETTCSYVFLEYESAVPSSLHLSKLIGDSLGLRVHDVRPDCVVDSSLVQAYQAAWQELPRPHIVIGRQASSWTPNKEWPSVHWAELLQCLTQSATVIEVGNSQGLLGEGSPRNYIDLRGRTSLDQLVAVLAASDLYVGPVSGPMHIAAAVGKRSVVIVSGYEQPANTEYPGNIALYTPVECSPCWLRTACPHNLKCMSAISADQVEEAILTLLRDSGTDQGSTTPRNSRTILIAPQTSAHTIGQA